METPLIDFAPKAVATIVKCQEILAEYVVPHSGISDHECINRLLGVLDDEKLVVEINQITRDRKSTGIFDSEGSEIFDGDKLRLVYETINIEGVARHDGDGWEIYKDEGNHLDLARLSKYITKI